MEIQYLGHASFMLTMNRKKLLIDPFISPNELAKAIDINTLNPDYILLTHGHQDHVADAEAIAQQSGATIITTFEVANWYQAKGLNCFPMNHGGKRTMDFGTIKLVNAVHSSVLPDGSYGGNPVGFVIWNDDDGAIYIAGDTALTMDMKLIPMTCPPLKVCIFPIGDHFTMGIEDAIIASDFVACDEIIGAHFDTFGFIEINKEEAKKAFAVKNKNLTILEIGASTQL